MNYPELADELHKRVNKKFKRRKVIVFDINDIWSADLVDMKDFKDDNDGWIYLLTVIDIFSKMAFVRPLKNKNGRSVALALYDIMEEYGDGPVKLWVDRGKEFYNREVKKLGLILYSTGSENKAVVIERFNKTLKDKMWRYFTKHQTRRWVDVVDDIVDKYNNTEHTTIKMKPVEVINNISKVRKIYKDKMVRKKPKFKVGDNVRISRVKGVFEKGYHPNWSYEIFKIIDIIYSNPLMYKLEDTMGDEIEGTFYEQEIQKTNMDNVFLVEKVLKKRKRGGKKQLFVKWLGYDEKFNQWIDEADIEEEKK